MKPGFVPEAGDVVWLQFDPQAGHEQAGHEQAGHEQAGHRPAIVLSPATYNARSGLILCCPTTTRIKGYPFEVPLAGTPPSVALADQVKSQDWRARNAQKKGRIGPAELAEIWAKLAALIGLA